MARLLGQHCTFKTCWPNKLYEMVAPQPLLPSVQSLVLSLLLPLPLAPLQELPA